MDLKEIQALIKFVAKSGAQEVSLETEDFKINIKTGPDASDQPTYVQAVAPQQMPVAAPAVTPVEAAPAAPTVPAEVDDSANYITIKSPMIGTFYRPTLSRGTTWHRNLKCQPSMMLPPRC